MCRGHPLSAHFRTQQPRPQGAGLAAVAAGVAAGLQVGWGQVQQKGRQGCALLGQMQTAAGHLAAQAEHGNVLHQLRVAHQAGAAAGGVGAVYAILQLQPSVAAQLGAGGLLCFFQVGHGGQQSGKGAGGEAGGIAHWASCL